MPDHPINDPFEYKEPKPHMLEPFKNVATAVAFAYQSVLTNCPDSAEKTLAIRALQQARMWANAAISFDGQPIKTTSG